MPVILVSWVKYLLQTVYQTDMLAIFWKIRLGNLSAISTSNIRNI